MKQPKSTTAAQSEMPESLKPAENSLTSFGSEKPENQEKRDSQERAISSGKMTVEEWERLEYEGTMRGIRKGNILREKREKDGS